MHAFSFSALTYSCVAILTGFHRESGTVEIVNIGNYNYTYDIRHNNRAGRTLALLSTTAETDMMRCEDCPSPTFKKFYDYYGQSDYGNAWVTAAFDGKTTYFQNGNADFSKANNESRVGKLCLTLRTCAWLFHRVSLGFVCTDCSRRGYSKGRSRFERLDGGHSQDGGCYR